MKTKEAISLLKRFRAACNKYEIQQDLSFYGPKLREVSRVLHNVIFQVLKGLLGREPTDNEVWEVILGG